MTREPYIVLRDVTVKYSDRNGPVFEGLDLELYPGEIVLIAGPNGGGKTTLVKTILGLVKPVSGMVSVLGRDPVRDPGVRREIGYVPQLDEVNIYAPITLYDFVMMGRYPRLPLLARPGEEDHRMVEEALRRVGLWDRRDYRLSEVSGGQLARAMIARALAQDPTIYILDEPFESIDFPSEERIMRVLEEEKGRGKLVILTEHHISDGEEIDRVILFRHGIVRIGPPGEVLRREVLEEAYR